jgi:hypothetical protein
MFWTRNPQPKKNEAKPEPKSADRSAKPASRSMRYYEHDGALRAYANRAMVIAFLSVPTTFLAVAFAAYVRLQPPTVIRVDANGEAAVVGQKLAETSLVNVTKGASTEPNDFDKKAFMRVFLEHYLNFSGDTVDRNWADALNMMTSNLRRSVLNAMEKDNAVGKIQDEQITSIFHLRSMEPSLGDPLSFTVYGVKEIHRVTDHHETSSKLVGKYHIRLITERRTEENPSGLLIAEYGEQLIEGEKQEVTAQSAGFAASHLSNQ